MTRFMSESYRSKIASILREKCDDEEVEMWMNDWRESAITALATALMQQLFPELRRPGAVCPQWQMWHMLTCAILAKEELERRSAA